VARDRTGPDAAIILYSLRTHQVQKLADSGFSPHCTADGKKIVYFAQSNIRILDLQTRAVTTMPFKVPGEQVDDAWLRLSRDGRTLYVRSANEQSDVWIAQLPQD
jgi:hypothetical protein